MIRGVAKSGTIYLLSFAAAGLLGSGCRPAEVAPISNLATATRVNSLTKVQATTTPSDTLASVDRPPSTPTPVPTTTYTTTPLPTETAQATSTPSPTFTPTPIGPCDQRNPADDLLTIVTLEYGLSRDYVPGDLVPLSDYLPSTVTLGYPNEVREIIMQPLVQLISQMQEEGLNPTIISGYRSYPAQAIAWSKWLEKEPERASILSAPPGFSEHQLGTTIDFGSPELPEIVDEEGIEFHTYFYMTGEGEWLDAHAHEYGFTLSYPREAFELTGFYYEPWHYRYVGSELATQLKTAGTFLAQYQFETQPVPCIP